MPSGNSTFTVLPASAVPLTCGLSLVTSLTVGATGGVVSFTSMTFSSDLLPDASVYVTLILSPPLNFLLVGRSIV
nr:hypothetical protein [Staphylococcus gallinarum]